MIIDPADWQLFYLLAAAAIVGFTKTSVGGVGILAVLLIALAFPGKASPGILLPMLIIADIMAVIYYRRDCQWKIIWRLLPLTIVGVVGGYFIVDQVPVAIFEKFLGIIILAMLGLSLAIEGRSTAIGDSRLFTGIVGAIAGASSMVANAAGPIFGIYLLQKGLNKQEFVGTRSWFFLMMNIIKVPFSIQLGLINTQTLTLNTYSIPFILGGAFIGVKVLGMINLTLFKWLIRVAVVIAAVRLIAF